jgi:hypothetical protein
MSTSKSLSRPAPGSPAINFISVAHALVVGECLSFRGAAKVLGIRQSSVSRGVRALEDKLGVSLFERHPSGVRITNAAFCSKHATGFFNSTTQSRLPEPLAAVQSAD